MNFLNPNRSAPSKPTVLASIEDDEHNRCIDLFSRWDGTFGFEEYRRDAEDGGLWTRVQYYSPLIFASLHDALSAAMKTVAWVTTAAQHSTAAQQILSLVLDHANEDSASSSG
jgi:hypothetical protein